MIKIPCVFVRDFTDKNKAVLTKEIALGCEWVLNGEGKATRKYDGTACAVINGVKYARYDAKRGKKPPAGAIPCCPPDEVTGHHPHWILLDENTHKYIIEAFGDSFYEDGTFEAVGEKINANKESLKGHHVVRHGETEVICPDRTFEGIFKCLSGSRIEGIVFHHPDGRMAKIRRNDYGLEWGCQISK